MAFYMNNSALDEYCTHFCARAGTGDLRVADAFGEYGSGYLMRRCPRVTAAWPLISICPVRGCTCSTAFTCCCLRRQGAHRMYFVIRCMGHSICMQTTAKESGHNHWFLKHIVQHGACECSGNDITLIPILTLRLVSALSSSLKLA